MQDIVSENELQKFLIDQPAQLSHIVALRSALRVLPLMVSDQKSTKLESESFINHVCLAIFRSAANAIESSKIDEPGKRIKNLPCIQSVDNARKFSKRNSSLESVTISMASALSCASINEMDAVRFCLTSVTGSIHAYSTSVKKAGGGKLLEAAWQSTIIDSVNADIKRAKEIDGLNIYEFGRLWPNVEGVVPRDVGSHWRRLKDILLAQDENWQNWIDWYESILRGKRPNTNFGSLVLKLSEGDWLLGAKHINSSLNGKLGEISKNGAFPVGSQIETPGDKRINVNDFEGAKIIALSLIEQIDSELQQLEGERPNSTAAIDILHKKKEFLNQLKANLTYFILNLNGNNEENSAILGQLASDLEEWLNNNGPELVDWAVRLSLITTFVGLLKILGAEMVIATPMVFAICGGDKAADVIEKIAHRNNSEDNQKITS